MVNPNGSTAEQELLQRVLDGETQNFYELVRPYERSVFFTAFAVLKNYADAEDAAQEAVIKAFRNLPRFRRESKFSTWLTRIALNEAKMMLRKARRHPCESTDAAIDRQTGESIPRELADWREIPSEALERKELRTAVREAVKSLPDKYRVVLVLRDIANLTTSEAAGVLGSTTTTIKTRLLRARLQMRERLSPAVHAQLGYTKSRNSAHVLKRGASRA
jgi:RNA polymerase sigma-70 factor, ECF subfamily